MLVAGRNNIRQSIIPWFARSSSQYVAFANLCRYSDRCHPTPKSTLPSNAVIFSGIQPTGTPHLGNYLGALQQWVRLQNDTPPTTKLFFSVVDLHAITARYDPENLRNRKYETLATLLAIGLDPSRSTIFFQSDVWLSTLFGKTIGMLKTWQVPAHTEFMWILSCSASMGYLSRMTQWKSKFASPEEASPFEKGLKGSFKLGLFSYPVLQAADILIHGATHVPVGGDQAQHLEFARECANGFNSLYGPVLVVPKTILSPTRRIMSLKEPLLKMSKSHEDPCSRVNLTDCPQDIRKKVKTALTDSLPGISYAPLERPGVSNLLEILSCLEVEGTSCQMLASKYNAISLRELKELVADKLVDHLSHVRVNYNRLIKHDNRASLQAIVHAGAIEARTSAELTLGRVRDAIGL